MRAHSPFHLHNHLQLFYFLQTLITASRLVSLAEHHRKPAMLTEGDDGRSLGWARLEHQCDQLLGLCRQSCLDVLLEGVLLRQLLADHCLLIMAVKGVRLKVVLKGKLVLRFTDSLLPGST